MAEPVSVSEKSLVLSEELVRRGDLDEVEKLLSDAEKRGINGRAIVNHRYGQWDQSPLHIASAEGYFDLVCLLLQHGADINAVDKNSWTPLHCAAKEHMEICEVLLEQSASVDQLNDAGTSAFHYLVRANIREKQQEVYRKVLGLMLRNGQDVNVQNLSGETPLHQACLESREASVSWLLEHGADIFRVNKYGETALHFAARSGSERIVQLLLDAGANPTAQGAYGTPRDVAENFNQTNIVQLVDHWVQHGEGTEQSSGSEDEGEETILSLMQDSCTPHSPRLMSPVAGQSFLAQTKKRRLLQSNSRILHSPSLTRSKEMLNGPVRMNPRQRRLRHVRTVAWRSLHSEIDLDQQTQSKQSERSLLDCWFSIHPIVSSPNQESTLQPADSPIYTSPTIRHTLNPTWTDLSLSSSAPDQYKQDTRFILRLYMKYSTAAEEEEEAPFMLDTVVRLYRLGFVGERLSEVVLPSNTLLIELLDGFYAREEVALLANKSTATPASLFPRKMTYNIQMLKRILSNQQRLFELREQNSQREKNLQNRLAPHQISLSKSREKDLLKNRIQELEKMKNEYEVKLQSEKMTLEDMRRSIVPKVQQLNKALVTVLSGKQELMERMKELLQEKEELADCCEMLEYRQCSLIYNLRMVYPITQIPNSQSLCINQIRLPNSAFTDCDEELIATGLGYVCHILCMVSKWLDVPLRYPMIPTASRSIIMDNISTKPTHSSKYPLYARGVERTRFDYAVYILNKNIEQLLNSQDMEIITLRHMLPNLQLLLISCSKMTSSTRQLDKRRTVQNLHQTKVSRADEHVS